LTQFTDDGFTGGFVVTWAEARAFFAGFGNHKVSSGSPVDDSFWLSSAAGQAYYDDVIIGDSPLTGGGDVAVAGDSLKLTVLPTGLGGPQTFVFGLQVSQSSPPMDDVTIIFRLER
jgi:hypothetical protein